MQIDWNKYKTYPYGEQRIQCLRELIEEADRQNYIEKQIALRGELCHDTNFYGDALESMVIFPQFISLCYQYPDRLLDEDRGRYKNAKEWALWVYKWVLVNCECFYQISRETWRAYLEDYKQKSLEYGYNLRPYYRGLYNFYENVDKEKKEIYLKKYQNIPWNAQNCDCKACEQHGIVCHYLGKGDWETARKNARAIEEMRLFCGQRGSKIAWMRLHAAYFRTYMEEKDFEKAENEIKKIEQIQSSYEERKEFQIFAERIYCYAHTDCGKALRLYKAHWKNLGGDGSPWDEMDNCGYVAGFLKQLQKVRKKQTIRVAFDASLPLYREDGIYQIQELLDYYQQKAYEYAERFDKRNGNHYCMEQQRRRIEK